jgi:hypothetical protein
MSDSNGDEDEPTTVHFVDGTAEAYNVVVRPYGSKWLYALRPGTAANHCVLNAENVTRIEAQTVAHLDGGVGYCNFDRRGGIDTFVKQESWIAIENDDGD